jgi:hypothetical protein
MPRLSTNRYLQIHHELLKLYQTNDGCFAGLSSAEQGALHTFFQITHQKPDKELVHIREHLSRIEPNLPQQAGRAYKHLQEQLKLFAQKQATSSTKRRSTRTRGERIVTIHTVQRPEPDYHALARAMVAMTRDQLNEQSSSQ